MFNISKRKEGVSFTVIVILLIFLFMIYLRPNISELPWTLSGIIILVASLILMNISCEILNPKRISIQTIFYFGYLLMIYFPVYIFFSPAPNSFVDIFENYSRYVYAFSVSGGLFFYSLGVYLTNKFFGFTVKNQENFFSGIIIKSNNDNNIYYLAMIMGAFCVILTILYFYQINISWSRLPIFFLFMHPGNETELTLLREQVFKLLDPRWSNSNYAFMFYPYLALRMWLYPFIVVMSFIYFLITREYRWLFIFLTCGFCAAFYAASSVARAPLAALIMRLCFSWYFYKQCKLEKIQAIFMICAIIAFPLVVTLLGYGNNDALKAIVLVGKRLFYTPANDLKVYFDAFPEHFDYQNGETLLKPLYHLLGLPHFYIENAIYHFQFPFSPVMSGHANAAFLSNLYADFGIFGCLFGSFLIGLLVQRINIYLVCQPKTPLNVTIYVYMMYSWWILTFGSITAVLGTNGIIFILFMPFLVKIFSKFNEKIIKYYI